MICLDDAAMARLIRAARAVPYHKRAALLKHLAAAVDPSKQLRNYRRRRAGMVRIKPAVDCADMVEFLHEAHVMVNDSSPETLADGFEKLMEEWQLGFLVVKNLRESM